MDEGEEIKIDREEKNRDPEKEFVFRETVFPAIFQIGDERKKQNELKREGHLIQTSPEEIPDKIPGVTGFTKEVVIAMFTGFLLPFPVIGPFQIESG